MRPDSVPPNDNTHHGRGHVAAMTAPNLHVVADGAGYVATHADWLLLDAPTRATGRYGAQPGRRIDRGPVFELGKDIIRATSLPAGGR